VTVSFAEAAQRGPSLLKRERCSVGKLLDELDPEERAGLETMLASGSGWGHQQIAEEIQSAGHYIQGTTVGRHRRNGCRCGLL
jgi:hypothetical protein